MMSPNTNSADATPAWNRSEDMHFGHLTEGMLVIVDDGFTCLEPWSVHELKYNSRTGWYVECGDGSHYLDGQQDFRYGTDIVVGMRRYVSLWELVRRWLKPREDWLTRRTA